VSPLIDLQRRMTEVGRLRMGHQVAHGQSRRPAKLEHWRITSRDRSRLDAIAALYGGTVEPWAERDGEFEVYTTVDELPILILPGQTLSQWWELWSGGGCVRRCDGAREMLSEQPCICESERGARKCKPTTRLSVMLPDVPGLGVYRLESHGYYAAVELSGTAAMLEAATVRGQLLPARLRIDQRRKTEGGKTTRFAVPVIDIDITARQALGESIATAAVGAAAPLEIERGFTPIEAKNGVTVNEALAAVAGERQPAGRGRQSAPIGPPAADLLPATAAPIPVAEDEEIGAAAEGPEVISDAQRTLLWTVTTSSAVGEDALRAVVMEVTGQRSTKLIAPRDFDRVLRGVEQLAAGQVLDENDPDVQAATEAAGFVVTVANRENWVNGLTLAQINADDRGDVFFRWALSPEVDLGNLKAAAVAYAKVRLPELFADLAESAAA
jgi:hypothetical protein